MVCAKCTKRLQSTSLATPAVKKKNEMYYGSPAGSKKEQGDKKATTLGYTGIGKSKLLSKAARNPYATYSTSCSKCPAKIEQGRKMCAKCAYQANACPGCGKTNSKSTNATPVVDGQKRTLK